MTEKDSQDIETTDHDAKNPSVIDTTINMSKTKAVKDSLKLVLIVIDTAYMDLSHQFEIGPEGLKGSKRKVKDGCVYAGSLEYEGKIVVNDILLSEREKGVGKRHFMIKYNKDLQSFSIKDMGDGLGTFIRVNRPLALQNLNIVSFGDSHMIVNIENNFISLRFIEGPKINYKS